MTKPQRLTVAHYLAKFSFVFVLAICAIIFYISGPVDVKNSTLQDFEIKKGDSVTTIASNLKSAGLIKSVQYFRLLVRVNKLSLQAGNFKVSPDAPPNQVALILTRGKAVDKKITIPEGYRLEQIAETAGLPVKDFLTTAKGMEGQLFPDTYFVKEGITAAELVKIMHDNYLKKVGNIDKDTLILASLIERETKGDAEKPVVAGILNKRMEAGWALELDATVQYFLGKPGAWWPNTTLLDRKLKSPYNTYLNQGLPPGPICNPGLASIKAAQNPVDSDYWFYLHDRNGNIHYGATLADHNANIAKYITN